EGGAQEAVRHQGGGGRGAPRGDAAEDVHHHQGRGGHRFRPGVHRRRGVGGGGEGGGIHGGRGGPPHRGEQGDGGGEAPAVHRRRAEGAGAVAAEGEVIDAKAGPGWYQHPGP